MNRKLTAWTCMVAMAGLLSGCASGSWFSSSADKINAAFPIAAEVLTSKADALQLANDEQKEVIEAQFDERLTQRAHRCAKDYSPSFAASAEGIRQNLGNPSCFAEADQEMMAWLGIRRVGLILKQSPHTPVPSVPPNEIMTESEILGTPLFADNAGIALLTTSSTIELIELNTSKVLLRERKQGAPGQLSPNGRLFITADTDRPLKIRDTLTGSVIAEIPGVLPWEFQWLDERTAFYFNRRGQSFFIDFASGETLATGVKNLVLAKSVRMPDVADQYAVLAGGKMLQFELARDKPLPELKLLTEKILQVTASASDGVTSDGGYFFNAISHFTLVDLRTLKSEEVSIKPFHFQTGIATSDPDKILVTGFIQPQDGIKPRDYLYSISNHTLAQIGPDISGLQRRIYLKPLRRMGMVDRNRIVMINELHAPGAIPLADFFRNAVAISEQRKLAIEARKLAEVKACQPSGEANQDGTELHAIGIYEGPIHRGEDLSDNKVNVKVYKTGQPIVLALFNYEPVVWNIQLDKGAEIKEIILSAPESTQLSVISKKSIKIFRPNFGSTYEDCAFFGRIAPRIKAFNGLNVTSFQGEYRGTGFPIRSQGQHALPVNITDTRVLESPHGLDEGLAAFEQGDHRTALDKLTPLAAKGNAIAQNTLGKMYMQSLGVPQDYGKALQLFRQAAKKKLPNAENNLGVMYAGGYGVPQDFKQAIAWFKKAANQGYAVAIKNLADINEKGVIVSRDPIEAEKWRNKLKGSAPEGSSTPVNIRFAGDDDYRKAQDYYYDGRFREAIPLFLDAAEKGHPEAQLKLAKMYRHGQGVEKDERQARHWEKKAAAQSYSDEDGRDRIYLIDTSSGGDHVAPAAPALGASAVRAE